MGSEYNTFKASGVLINGKEASCGYYDSTITISPSCQDKTVWQKIKEKFRKKPEMKTEFTFGIVLSRKQKRQLNRALFPVQPL